MKSTPIIRRWTGRALSSLALLTFLWLALPVYHEITHRCYVPQPNGLAQAEATAQWSRKYKVNCQTCHTVFPRLNPYGERFMMNGYQDPEEDADGDTLGKRAQGDNAFIDEVGNWFGMRLNVTPFQSEENKLTVNGKKQTRLTLGKTGWLQFFVAGTIFKNTSIFIENELSDAGKIHFSWYKLGLHNWAGTWGNLIIGGLSPLDYTSYSNRLRQFAPVKAVAFGETTSNGLGQNSINASSARRGFQWYGYQGPVVLSAGVSPGSGDGTGANEYLQGWGNVMLRVPENDVVSALEGTSISGHLMSGKDAKVSAVAGDIVNDFQRFIGAVNLRVFETIDVQAAYLQTEEENVGLSATTPKEEVTRGGSVIATWLIASKHYPGVQWDKVEIDDKRTKEVATLSYSYLMRENFRVGLYYTHDIMNESNAKQNKGLVNLRTMF